MTASSYTHGGYYVGDVPDYPAPGTSYPPWQQWQVPNSVGIGWECPNCRHIYSPYQSSCVRCNLEADLKSLFKEKKEEKE